mmetsp:Transcript_4174/g.5800  ORF Transcript_4174/g.5800 Transcript_4174/m.5800 type:complete len:377 (-) Transcript_4174:65-1195(-)|eukprot:CAMPEP_0184859748 /NCGR_PEP_ID=MMETSP0580-20130426/4736_1 /TAXON_ID=1118495 /ORGANISM="Dactyliosolen fragilissimus" /LENGTH=376 /DNA_ID=CAMNT_0027356563 /DNA_START=432 /DNA_END=1562 /DNA_ORIENTATION=-
MRFTVYNIPGLLVTAAVVVSSSSSSSHASFIQTKHIHNHYRSQSQTSPSFQPLHPQYASVTAAVNGDANTDSSINNNNNNIRLSVEEKAKTVISVCTSGTLCTTSSTHDDIAGAPFGSFVDYVLDDDGFPVLLMNEMSMHTINIASAGGENALVSLFTQLDAKSSNKNNKEGQDISRCSLTGTIQRIDPDTAEDIDAIRMRYSIRHSYADQVMDSPKFAFYRLIPKRVYFVGGFGVLAKWVDVEDYRDAAPDILANEASDIVARLNREHADDLVLTAKHLLKCEEELEGLRVTNVDRLGMDIRVTTRGKRRRNNKLTTDEFRIGFRIPVISVEDAKSEVLKIFQEAWEKGNGYTWETDEDGDDEVPIMKIAEDSLG